MWVQATKTLEEFALRNIYVAQIPTASMQNKQWSNENKELSSPMKLHTIHAKTDKSIAKLLFWLQEFSCTNTQTRKTYLCILVNIAIK